MRHDRRLQPLDDARPLAEPSVVDAVLDAALEQHLHADADAEHRAPAGQPAADDLVALDGAQPVMHAANAPTPGTTSPSHVQRGVRSAVSVTSAPARSSARTAERRLPEP